MMKSVGQFARLFKILGENINNHNFIIHEPTAYVMLVQCFLQLSLEATSAASYYFDSLSFISLRLSTLDSKL